MPTQNQNPFRQVALLLISLTIITVGILYNQASTPASEAQFGTSTRTTIPQIPTSSTPTSTSPSSPTTTPSQPFPSTNTNTTPPITGAPTNIGVDTDKNLPELTLEDIWLSLQFLRQLTQTPAIFAYSMPEVNLPGIGAVTPDFATIVSPITPTPPSIGGTTTSATTTDQTTDNEVIATLKALTGYSQWEEFRTNFRTAREQYAGTGKCMVDIQGLGCLIEW
ncbi:TPA: hypothetical protein DIV45_01555 [Patescibacteria group bacterium]|nr:hypothetical protein [Patescibacteria group bacterium]